MKIMINRKPVFGPWGGGIKTVNKMVERLQASGHEVVFRLESNIDIIFCIDPRPNEYGEWYQNFLNYKMQHNIKIIQRVGDLGTHGKPELTNLLRQTLNYSDFMIFPSEWAKEWINYRGKNCKVVNNRPMKIFHKYKNNKTSLNNKVKLVTHHWSTNPKKGFDFYENLQKYVNGSEEYDFTYIGRKPEQYKFSNYLPPLPAEEVAKELPRHNIYITASREEAGANHVLEAMAAGLPVVYHSAGGSVVNYCSSHGESYEDVETMIAAIKKVVAKYDFYKNKVLEYNEDIECVIDEYEEIINNV